MMPGTGREERGKKYARVAGFIALSAVAAVTVLLRPGYQWVSLTVGVWGAIAVAASDLPGGILENFGRLLKNDLKVYVYPLQRSPTEELQTIHTVKVTDDLQPLYDYLVRRGSFVQLDNYNPKYLSIFSRDVLKRIAAGDESWDEMVPPQVADIVRQRGFFGYKKG